MRGTYPQMLMLPFPIFSLSVRVTSLKQLSLAEFSRRWVSVVEFHHPALSIGKGFGQESTVVKWNYQILSLHLVTVCQKVPIFDFQSEFSTSKIIRIFIKKISLQNINSGTPIFKKTFFTDSISKPLYLLKWCPLFDELSLDGDPKFANLIWLQLILGKKLCFLGPIQLIRRKVNIH